SAWCCSSVAGPAHSVAAVPLAPSVVEAADETQGIQPKDVHGPKALAPGTGRALRRRTKAREYSRKTSTAQKPARQAPAGHLGGGRNSGDSRKSSMALRKRAGSNGRESGRGRLSRGG